MGRKLRRGSGGLEHVMLKVRVQEIAEEDPGLTGIICRELSEEIARFRSDVWRCGDSLEHGSVAVQRKV